jgi:5'(3')-deoxyribonucleotidase
MGFGEFFTEKYAHNIFVDLDGVLTDFDKAYIELTGSHPTVKKDNMKEFWKPVNEAGVDFWERMEWMKDGKELWKHIKRYSPTILSSPSDHHTSKKGKINWLRRELMGVPYILEKNKHIYVRNGEFDILIDDTQEKIDYWIEAGGTGILHKNTKETIQKLNKIIR